MPTPIAVLAFFLTSLSAPTSTAHVQGVATDAGPADSRIALLQAAKGETKKADGSDTAKEDEPEQTAADLLQNGDQSFARNQFADAAKVYEQAADAAHAEKDASLETEALSQVARCHLIQGDLEGGLPWLEKAKAVASDDKPLGWSRYLGVRGRFEWKGEEGPEVAKATFIEMYDYCLEQALYSRAIDAAHMVAIVGTPEEQIEWALKGIEAAEKGGFEGWLGPLWNNLGWTYDERDEHEKALDALQKAREYHYKTSGDSAKLAADFGVGHALRRAGRLEEARECLEKAFAWAKKRYEEDPDDNDRVEWMGWGHKYVGELLADEGKPAEALTEMRAARPYLVKAGIEKWWPDGLKKLDDRIAELEKLAQENSEG